MKTRFSPALLGTLSMMACAFLWSVAGLFIKILDWNPFPIAGIHARNFNQDSTFAFFGLKILTTGITIY